MGAQLSAARSNIDPIRQVQGCNDTPLPCREETIAAFFDSEPKNNGKSFFVVVITPKRVESFNASTGARLRSFTFQGSDRALCATFSNASSISASIFVGLSSGYVNGYSSPSLKEVIRMHSRYPVSPVFPNPSIASLCCPLNNTLVCGYRTGHLLSFFLDTQQPAIAYHPRLDLFSTSAGRNPTEVSCISFRKSPCWIIVGYSSQSVFDNLATRTPTGHGTQSRPPRSILSPPIIVYSLQTAEVLKSFQGAKSTILFAALVYSNKFIVGATYQEALVWSAEASDAALSILVFSEAFDILGEAVMCHSAAWDNRSNVIFVGFSSGNVASIQLSFSPDPRNRQSVTSVLASSTYASAVEQTPSATAIHDASAYSKEVNLLQCVELWSEGELSNENVYFCPQRLLQVRSDTLSEDQFYRADSSPVLIRRAVTSLWFECRTDTVVAGDSAAGVFLAPNFFDRHAATRVPNTSAEHPALSWMNYRRLPRGSFRRSTGTEVQSRSSYSILNENGCVVSTATTNLSNAASGEPNPVVLPIFSPHRQPSEAVCHVHDELTAVFSATDRSDLDVESIKSDELPPHTLPLFSLNPLADIERVTGRHVMRFEAKDLLRYVLPSQPDCDASRS